MRAVVAASAGGPEVLAAGDWAEPDSAAGHVLVRVGYAGVNFADVLMRAGESGASFPFVPGVEGAGRIVAVGDGVTTFAPGDRVAWAPVAQASSVGSYAALAAVPEAQLLPVARGRCGARCR